MLYSESVVHHGMHQEMFFVGGGCPLEVNTPVSAQTDFNYHQFNYIRCSSAEVHKRASMSLGFQSAHCGNYRTEQPQCKYSAM